MGYLPVEPAAEDKTGDVEILAPANHDCQPIDSRIDMRGDLSWRNYLNPALTTNLDSIQTHRPQSVAELDRETQNSDGRLQDHLPGFPRWQ